MTAQSSTRRDFLRGRLETAPALRPFGAVAEREFHDLCSQCGDCARACPEEIIARGAGGFPTLALSAGACTFCAACVEACATGALSAAQPWPWRAEVGSSCLSASGVYCRICDDQCDARAIRFRLAPGGRSEPEIDGDACTGCGGCVAPCPAGALALVRVQPRTETRPC